MSKHRKLSKRSKKFAAVGATTATAAALTVGFVPGAQRQAESVRDVVLTAGPDYFQLIEDMSNSYDNILIAQGNVGGAAAAFWQPFAAASGGLLPSFSAGTTQTRLDTISDILKTLSKALDEGTDISVVPGISNEAAATVLEGMLAGLGVDTGLVATLGAVIGYLGVLNGTLESVGDLVDLVNDLDALDLLDVISLSDLLGLTATQTEFTSSYSWLGLTGLTEMGNTYVNLDPITVAGLVGNLEELLPDLLPEGTLLDDLLNSLGIDLGGLVDLDSIDDLVAQFDILATPEITAWIPAASGAYDLPLGGSVGYLAAMPTIAIGPLGGLVDSDLIDLGDLGLDGLDGIADLDSATVVAIPISAAGAELPLNLASFGFANANVLFPTATGVTSLAGTTLQTLNIPLLGTSITSLNALQASYVGTNGFNVNTGQTVLAIVTPVGPVPLVYSLGAVNAGNSGIGVTLPSLFGVGLVPPIQIGEPVGQESSDGLVGRDILNLGLAAPTQVTNVAELVGMGAVFTPAEELGTGVWNATVRPIGEQITAALNEVNGPITNGVASGFEQLTGAAADATGSAPATTSALAASAQPSVAASTTSKTEPALSVNEVTNVSARLDERLKLANERIATATTNARERTEAAVKRTQTQLNRIAAEGQKTINNTVNGVKQTVDKTVKTVKDAADNLTKKKDTDSKSDNDAN